MTAGLWEVASSTSHPALRHQGMVFSVAFNRDGSRLATGCNDNVVRLWDTETGDEVIELRGHTGYVHAVAFSPDGSMLASASGDRTVRIWDSRSPFERHSAPGPTPQD